VNVVFYIDFDTRPKLYSNTAVFILILLSELMQTYEIRLLISHWLPAWKIPLIFLQQNWEARKQ